MKKLLVSLLLVLCLAMPCWAETLTLVEAMEDVGEVLEKLPDVKQGLIFDINDNNISYLATVEVASYKGFTLEAGYSQKNKIMAVVSYPLLKLVDFGIDLPILRYIEANIGYGIGVEDLFDRECELQQGVTLTLIKVRF